MVLVPQREDLRALIRAAGYPTDREFAEAAGLDPSTLSKLCSESSDRRATPDHVRKIAHKLGKRVSEIVPLLVASGGLEHDLLAEFAADRERIGTLESQLSDVTKTAGGLHSEKERLKAENADLLRQLRASQAESRERGGQVRDLRRAVRRMDHLLHEQTAAIEKLRSRVEDSDRQHAEEIKGLNERIDQARRNEVIRTVLTTAVSMAAGAVIRGAANGRGRQDEDEYEELDDEDYEE